MSNDISKALIVSVRMYIPLNYNTGWVGGIVISGILRLRIRKMFIQIIE